MYKHQLDSLMNDAPIFDKNFGGVYALNTLPSHPSPGYAYIINTDPINRPGTHWVAIYLHHNPNMVPEFFDSLGKKPKSKHFFEFLSAYPYFIYNNVQLQSPLSTLCGAYCLYFICERLRGQTFVEIISKFNWENLGANDNYVKNYMKKKFKFHLPVVNNQFLIDMIQRSANETLS